MKMDWAALLTVWGYFIIFIIIVSSVGLRAWRIYFVEPKRNHFLKLENGTLIKLKLDQNQNIRYVLFGEMYFVPEDPNHKSAALV